MLKQIYLFATSKHQNVTNVQSLKVKLLKPSIDFSKYDYLIITSKQTIKALSQYEKSDFINIPALCISTKTADLYKKSDGKILDIGDGYGDNLVNKIVQYPKDSRWLYLRAQEIASDFVKNTHKLDFMIDEEILYISECATEEFDIKIQSNSILIFTSPSSIRCFLKKHTIDESYSVIVIGDTTAKALPKEVEYKIAQKRSIESCIEIAVSLLKDT